MYIIIKNQFTKELISVIFTMIIFIAGSSNGRTTVSGTVYLGSNPSPAALRHSVPQGLRPLSFFCVSKMKCENGGTQRDEGHRYNTFLIQKRRFVSVSLI